MGRSPDSGIYLAIFRLTICLTQEEDVRGIWRFVESYKGPYYIWACLSDDRKGKMDQESAYNWKISAKGHIGRTPGLQVFSK